MASVGSDPSRAEDIRIRQKCSEKRFGDYELDMPLVIEEQRGLGANNLLGYLVNRSSIPYELHTGEAINWSRGGLWLC